MNKEVKGFVCGLIFTLLLLNPLKPLALNLGENIFVYFNKANIQVNGTPLTIGNFVYKNTTYVPLRDIATALWKNIAWDSLTNTAYITDIISVPENNGNSIGNIVNGSLVASEADWIYYRSLSDRKIYRTKYDGSSRTIVCDNYSGGFNISDDWIYFSAYDNEKKSEHLYKIKTDGSNLTKLFDGICNYINVVDDWIYFLYSTDSCIYKIKIDGSSIIKLNNDAVQNLVVADSWIYYSILIGSGDGSDRGLYKMKPDGSEKTKLVNDVATQLNIVGDWIYYINYAFEYGDLSYYSDEIYKVKKDGSSKYKVINDDARLMNVCGDWIYYTTHSKLCKAKIDGSQKLILEDEVYNIQHLYILGDWIYYIEYSNPVYKLHRLKTDGTCKAELPQ